jgi:hypothetical protein
LIGLQCGERKWKTFFVLLLRTPGFQRYDKWSCWSLEFGVLVALHSISNLVGDGKSILHFISVWLMGASRGEGSAQQLQTFKPIKSNKVTACDEVQPIKTRRTEKGEA